MTPYSLPNPNTFGMGSIISASPSNIPYLCLYVSPQEPFSLLDILLTTKHLPCAATLSLTEHKPNSDY